MNWRSAFDWITKGYDFYKGVIVSTGGLVVIFLGLGLFQASQARSLDQAIRLGTADLKEIYQKTEQIFAFNQELKGDPFAASGSDIAKPIRTFFYEAGLGNPSINPRREESNSIETVHYTISVERDKAFTRSQIASFLQRLENSTTRARITGIKLTPPAGEKVTPGQRREDIWTGEMRVTTRRRVEKPK